jgi:hypothetical protein
LLLAVAVVVQLEYPITLKAVLVAVRVAIYRLLFLLLVKQYTQ